MSSVSTGQFSSNYAWFASKEHTHTSLLNIYHSRPTKPSSFASLPASSLRTKCDMLESAVVEHEYRDQILQHMLTMERETMCDSLMIDTQPEIEWRMRPYLIDFLTRSHLSLRLNQETLFLAINIVDRYSSQRIVFMRHYQLLGATALWIASKYQDKKSRVPTLEELQVLCSGAYDSTMFTQMELHILNTLEWAVGHHPTVDLFVDMCFQNPAANSISDKDERTKLRHLTLFFCENANYQQEMLNYPASIIASAAFKLALRMMTLGRLELGAYDKNEGDCIDALLQHSGLATEFLQRKYSIPEFSKAYQVVIVYHKHQQYQQLIQLQQKQESERLRQEETQQEQQQETQHLQKKRSLTPVSQCINRITTPTRYHQKPQETATTPVKSSASGNKTNGSNSQVGYMTPPFTPGEENVQQGDKQTLSCRTVSASKQLKQEGEKGVYGNNNKQLHLMSDLNGFVNLDQCEVVALNDEMLELESNSSDISTESTSSFESNATISRASSSSLSSSLTSVDSFFSLNNSKQAIQQQKTQPPPASSYDYSSTEYQPSTQPSSSSAYHDLGYQSNQVNQQKYSSFVKNTTQPQQNKLNFQFGASSSRSFSFSNPPSSTSSRSSINFKKSLFKSKSLHFKSNLATTTSSSATGQQYNNISQVTKIPQSRSCNYVSLINKKYF